MAVVAPVVTATAQSAAVVLRFRVAGCDTAVCQLRAVWCKGESGPPDSRTTPVRQHRAVLRVPRAETKGMYFIVSFTDAQGSYHMTNVVLDYPGIRTPSPATLTGRPKGRIFWAGASRPVYAVRLNVEPVTVLGGVRAYQEGTSLKPVAVSLDTFQGATNDSEFCSP